MSAVAGPATRHGVRERGPRPEPLPLHVRANRGDHVGFPSGNFGGFSWRRHPLDHVITYCRSKGAQCEKMDVYQFGVYSGLSMRAISQTLLKAGVSFHRLWGFDSFHGLPDERTSTGATPRYVTVNGFTRGNFDIVSSWQADSADSAMHRIKSTSTARVFRWCPASTIPRLHASSRGACGRRCT